jgi:DNA-binding transcriptional LysR family regulator
MGSFIKAAHALELPRATVSAAIAQLESALGTRLLHRTTRQVSPTADGLRLQDRLRELLVDAEEIDHLFVAGQRQVVGQLTINVPSRIAARLIVPALPELLVRHPRLQLALGSSDRAIDLVQDGVDCAVRVGKLTESSLAVRPIGRISLVNCASPAYLAERGVPTRPQDLADGHCTVGYASAVTGRKTPWSTIESGQEQQQDLPSLVIVNNAENYIACCKAGLGLIQIPRFDVQASLQTGELVEVMPQYRAAPMPMSLVYPHRRQRSRRLSAFVEWFETLMRPHLDP